MFIPRSKLEMSPDAGGGEEPLEEFEEQTGGETETTDQVTPESTPEPTPEPPKKFLGKFDSEEAAAKRLADLEQFEETVRKSKAAQEALEADAKALEEYNKDKAEFKRSLAKAAAEGRADELLYDVLTGIRQEAIKQAQTISSREYDRRTQEVQELQEVHRELSTNEEFADIRPAVNLVMQGMSRPPQNMKEFLAYSIAVAKAAKAAGAETPPQKVVRMRDTGTGRFASETTNDAGTAPVKTPEKDAKAHTDYIASIMRYKK